MTVPINLEPNPYYEATKNLDGYEYLLTVRWNIYASKWVLDIKGKTNDVDVKGIALLPGKDLFKRYGYLELGELWVIDNSGANEDPNFDDIGTRFTVEYTPIS